MWHESHAHDYGILPLVKQKLIIIIRYSLFLRLIKGRDHQIIIRPHFIIMIIIIIIITENH